MVASLPQKPISASPDNTAAVTLSAPVNKNSTISLPKSPYGRFNYYEKKYNLFFIVSKRSIIKIKKGGLIYEIC